jgi:hypothetical protein
MFVRRLMVLAVRVVVILVVAITFAVAGFGLDFREVCAAGAGSVQVAVLELRLPLVAYSLKFSFLPFFQGAANIRVFALILPALA